MRLFPPAHWPLLTGHRVEVAAQVGDVYGDLAHALRSVHEHRHTHSVSSFEHSAMGIRKPQVNWIWLSATSRVRSDIADLTRSSASAAVDMG